MKISVNIKPISTNKLWLGRKWKTKEYKEYEKLMLYLLPQKKMIKGLLKVDIKVYLKKAWLKSDVSNFVKALEDICQKKEYFEDDRFIIDERIRKFKGNKDKVIIEIKKYD